MNEVSSGQLEAVLQVFRAEHNGLRDLINQRIDSLEVMMNERKEQHLQLRGEVDQIVEKQDKNLKWMVAGAFLFLLQLGASVLNWIHK